MNDEDINEEYDEEYTRELEFEENFYFIIDKAKEIKTLITIINEPTIDIYKEEKLEVDSEEINKYSILKKIIEDKLEILHDEIGMSINKFQELY